MGFVHRVIVDEDAAGGERRGGGVEAEVRRDVATTEAGGRDVVREGGGGEGFAEEVFVADEGRRGVELGGGVEVDRVVIGVSVEADENGVDVT